MPSAMSLMRCQHPVADLRPIGAERALDRDAGRDLVGRQPAIDHADRDHRAVERIDIARDDGLQRHDQMPHGDDRIARQIGLGGMAGRAVQRDHEAPGLGHDRPVMHGDRAGLEPRPVVEAEDALHREALEQPVGDHRARAGAVLLRRLEQQLHRAAPALVGSQERGRAEQRDGVAVMAAGMHDLRRGRGIGAASFASCDRQRIHVGAQADRTVRAAAAQRRDHAMAADAGGEGHAELRQLLADEGAGLLLLQRQFGIGVEMAAPAGEHVEQALDPRL